MKSDITVILNRYKDTLDDLIDSSDSDLSDRSNSLDWPGLIDKGLCNTSRFKDGLSTFLKEHWSEDNISVILLELTFTI